MLIRFHQSVGLRRIGGLSTELEDVTEVEYRQLRLERVVLAGLWTQGTSHDAEVSLRELAALAETAGSEVLDGVLQRRPHPDPATYVGKGKAEEFAKFCQLNDVDTVIFDDELSPAQTRNLEKIFEIKILDRTALILDIFSQRARTREGKLQIELAQLQHLLPRLTRFWGHLSRQSGGIGMRGGEGETQLEADRRKVGERIDRITRDLDAVLGLDDLCFHRPWTRADQRHCLRSA